MEQDVLQVAHDVRGRMHRKPYRLLLLCGAGAKADRWYVPRARNWLHKVQVLSASLAGAVTPTARAQGILVAVRRAQRCDAATGIRDQADQGKSPRLESYSRLSGRQNILFCA